MEEIELQSGVTVIVRPFPADLYQDIMARAIQDYPEPVPPQKEISTVTGPETIDDTEDEEYKAKKAEMQNERYMLIAEAALDLCIDVKDFEKWGPFLERLEKKYLTAPLPKDDADRKVWFLRKYALRSPADLEMIVSLSISQTMVGEKEVRERLEFFRRALARTEDSERDAPGATETQPVDVE